MPESIPESLQQKIEERLRYYEDLGIRLFYRDRVAGARFSAERIAGCFRSACRFAFHRRVPCLSRKTKWPCQSAQSWRRESCRWWRRRGLLYSKRSTRCKDDSLLKIREDLGDCTRCKLHKKRNKLVFGDGSAKAQLVFVGEGPGADEDAQGLPFVGRAGKLLTQMIEAMGLQRSDVYICNVVKCRPPENRAPEPDEVTDLLAILVAPD